MVEHWEVKSEVAGVRSVGMTWFVCTISKGEPENWDLCKSTELWGIPGKSKLGFTAKEGDHLLFWLGGRGYAGIGTVMGEARVAKRSSEIPWAGGLARWSYLIPIRFDLEVKQPLFIGFVRSHQYETDFTLDKFQRGFAPVPDEPAEMIAERLRTRSVDERAIQSSQT